MDAWLKYYVALLFPSLAPAPCCSLPVRTLRVCILYPSLANSQSR